MPQPPRRKRRRPVRPDPVAYDEVRPVQVIAEVDRAGRTFLIGCRPGPAEHDVPLHLLTDDDAGFPAEIAVFTRTGPTRITAEVTTAILNTGLDAQALQRTGVDQAVNALALALFDGVPLDPGLGVRVLADPDVARRFTAHGWHVGVAADGTLTIDTGAPQ